MSTPLGRGTAGTSGVREVRVGLRAPRVVVGIEADSNWQSRAALALHAAGKVWGGSGFVVAPESATSPCFEVRRLLRLYDPDYVLGLTYTFGDIEMMEPGWTQQNTNLSLSLSDPAFEPLREQHAPAALEPTAALEATDFYKWDIDGVDGRPAHWIAADGLPTELTHVDAFSASAHDSVLAVPESVTGTLGLALAIRCGFVRPPRLPFDGTIEDLEPSTRSSLIRYAILGDDYTFGRPDDLLIHTTTRHAQANRDAVPVAWINTMAGLAWVGRYRRRSSRLVVVGSSPDDFALALAWSRISQRDESGSGMAVWLPGDWLEHSDAREDVRGALSLLNTRHDSLAVTSTSISPAQLHSEFTSLLAYPEIIYPESNDDGATSREQFSYIPPADLVPSGPSHLAISPDDFDINLALPVVEDDSGGLTFSTQIPAQIPGIQGPLRPFWEVDVEVFDNPMPRGRKLPATSLVPRQTNPWPTHVRSGRDGISFYAHDQGLVPGGASLRQSVARPRLRLPGLLDWVTELCANSSEVERVALSDAGKRAETAARLMGSRQALGKCLHDLGPLFDAFQVTTKMTTEAYPAGDGVVVDDEGFLRFKAALRTLGSRLSSDQIRQELDQLLVIGVLHRGLVLRCSECAHLAFFRIERIGQTFECQRCGFNDYLTQEKWRHPSDEPYWFYDLNSSFRNLFKHNGNVPMLASNFLASSDRRYTDVSELDFHLVGRGNPIEVDLVAVSSDQLLVGEAKLRPTLGSGAASRAHKLTEVAHILQADQIVLCSAKDQLWSDASVRALRHSIDDRSWSSGRKPTIRLLHGLTAAKPSDTGQDGEPCS